MNKELLEKWQNFQRRDFECEMYAALGRLEEWNTCNERNIKQFYSDIREVCGAEPPVNNRMRDVPSKTYSCEEVLMLKK